MLLMFQLCAAHKRSCFLAPVNPLYRSELA